MKALLLTSILILSFYDNAKALVISEVMSNPIGDDSGREWVEVYNDTDQAIDISSLSISIKGAAAISATPLSGGASIPPYGYGIIGSTVSGATKFLADHPLFDGVLFRSGISLVNTGITSIDIKVSGATVASLPSYTAAKEGHTYSLIGGSYEQGNPTPGKENQSGVSSSDTPSATASSTNPNQATYLQASVPTSDIVLYLPNEKIVVAGASSLFSVFSLTHAGRAIENVLYTWSFGDGGTALGSSTMYRYYYPGVYTVQVEGTNGQVFGVGSIKVRVVAPDITMSKILTGKYGSYIALTNPNDYDLDVSLWKLSIDGAGFTFPKNTIIRRGSTIIPGQTLGFASTMHSSSTVIKLLFPSLEEVTRVYQDEAFALEKNMRGNFFSPYENMHSVVATSSGIKSKKNESLAVETIQKYPSQETSKLTSKVNSLSVATSSQKVRQKAAINNLVSSSTKNQKDTRIATWMKSLFNR